MVMVLVKSTLLTYGVRLHLINSLFQAVWDSPKPVAFVCNLCYDWLSLHTLIPQDIIQLPSICEHFNKQNLSYIKALKISKCFVGSLL